MASKLILLFGGESNERLVSFTSAQNMSSALPECVLWYWHHDSQIYELTYEELQNHKDSFTKSYQPKHKPKFTSFTQAIKHETGQDSIFILGLHGGAGENGEVQKILEQAKLKFTGSNSQTSKLAFDKMATKQKLVPTGLLMSPHVGLNMATYEILFEELSTFFDTHGPMIIKPNCGGSSLGCFIIKARGQLDQVADQLMSNNQQESNIVEKFIIGRELTVGVIEHQHKLIALSPTEIILQANRDFDYEGKYLGLGSQEITPAQVSPKDTRRAQDMALQAHRTLGLRGYSRTDMILSTTNNLYFLEINTLPGLTKQSLVPQQLAHANITMRDFLLEQINT